MLSKNRGRKRLFFTFYHLQRLKKGQLTRITFWNDYFRPHFDIVPVTMYQQGRCNAERSLLLFVEQHRPPAGALEPHHPRQRESIEELAQGHVAAAGAGTTLGRRLPRARQRLGQRGHLLARHRRKLAVRRHLCDNLDSPPPGKRRFFLYQIPNVPNSLLCIVPNRQQLFRQPTIQGIASYRRDACQRFFATLSGASNDSNFRQHFYPYPLSSTGSTQL